MNREFEQKYKFDFEMEEDASNIILKANESLFQKVIENIINNSIHHNPNGCSIKIKLLKQGGFSNEEKNQISYDWNDSRTFRADCLRK